MLILGIDMYFGDVISFVGAGGKTSLIFSIANRLVSFGYSVLVTTTTAILHPKETQYSYDEVLFGELEVSNYDLLFGKVIVAAASYSTKKKKMMGYSLEYVDVLKTLNLFDFILVEADGSRRKPIKAPASHEPVIPKFTNTVVGCLGLDVIDKSIDENNVHRPELLMSISKKRISSKVTKEIIISLVAAEAGMFKNSKNNMRKIVFCNKVDNDFLLKKGKNIALLIKKKCPKIDNVVLASLIDKTNPIRLVI